MREFQKNYFCYLYIQIAWMIFDLFNKIWKHKWAHKCLWHKNGRSDLIKFWWLLVQIYTNKVWNNQKVSYHRTGGREEAGIHLYLIIFIPWKFGDNFHLSKSITCDYLLYEHLKNVQYISETKLASIYVTRLINSPIDTELQAEKYMSNIFSFSNYVKKLVFVWG